MSEMRTGEIPDDWWENRAGGSAEKKAIESLKAENAKLRELVADIGKALFTLNIDYCQACPRDTINGPCTKYLVGGSDECSFKEDMRELGIEVEHD